MKKNLLFLMVAQMHGQVWIMETLVLHQISIGYPKAELSLIELILQILIVHRLELVL